MIPEVLTEKIRQLTIDYASQGWHTVTGTWMSLPNQRIVGYRMRLVRWLDGKKENQEHDLKLHYFEKPKDESDTPPATLTDTPTASIRALLGLAEPVEYPLSCYVESPSIDSGKTSEPPSPDPPSIPDDRVPF